MPSLDSYTQDKLAEVLNELESRAEYYDLEFKQGWQSAIECVANRMGITVKLERKFSV